jgi:aryl-alcohol dehydrogenase-like predicted oxidoreductase
MKQAASLNAAAGGETPEETDALVAENESGYIAVSDEIADVIEKAAEASTDFRSFQKELKQLVSDWTPDKIAECIAVATFKARARGDAEFDRED